MAAPAEDMPSFKVFMWQCLFWFDLFMKLLELCIQIHIKSNSGYSQFDVTIELVTKLSKTTSKSKVYAVNFS